MVLVATVKLGVKYAYFDRYKHFSNVLNFLNGRSHIINIRNSNKQTGPSNKDFSGTSLYEKKFS